MLREFLLKSGIKSQAKYVEMGYGQVEPNHLSAQRNAQIYAQLPADPAIEILEQGQFVKYDYAAGLVNFTGAGEWMLVYNETKLYREHQMDCEFAMKKGDYVARVYSPVAADTNFDAQSRYYGGKDVEGNDIEKVTAAADMYELHYNEDPFHIESQTAPKSMDGKVMTPRVFKTNVGDIMTTNTLVTPNTSDSAEVNTSLSVSVGNYLVVGSNGFLAKATGEGKPASGMVWKVVKEYTMPDKQPGIKIQRVQ